MICHHDYQFILLFCLPSFMLRSGLEYKKLDFLYSGFIPFLVLITFCLYLQVVCDLGFVTFHNR